MLPVRRLRPGGCRFQPAVAARAGSGLDRLPPCGRQPPGPGRRGEGVLERRGGPWPPRRGWRCLVVQPERRTGGCSPPSPLLDGWPRCNGLGRAGRRGQGSGRGLDTGGGAQLGIGPATAGRPPGRSRQGPGGHAGSAGPWHPGQRPGHHCAGPSPAPGPGPGPVDQRAAIARASIWSAPSGRANTVKVAILSSRLTSRRSMPSMSRCRSGLGTPWPGSVCSGHRYPAATGL